MLIHSLPLTRRQVFAGIAASPVAGLVPFCIGSKEKLHQMIGAIEMPFKPSKLELVSVSEVHSTQGIALEAVVKLVWAPGSRQRVFRVSADSSEAAIEQVVSDVLHRFSVRT